MIDFKYIEKILDFIKKEKFDKIYCIVDCNSGSINIPLKLSSKIDAFFYKNYAGFEICDIEEMIDTGKAYVVKECIAWSLNDQLLIATDNHHETQIVNEDLGNLIALIKNENNILIGGSYCECLQDIEKVFEYYNIDYMRENSLVYPIYNPVISNYDTIDWIEIECPY